MFTGLVEEVGEVVAVERGSAYRRLRLRAAMAAELRPGASVSVDGACQTVTEVGSSTFSVETLATSLEKTTLGGFAVGRRVNLERSMTLGGRLDGHLVQGHVEARARVVDVRRAGPNGFLTLALPTGLGRFCIAEGSVAVDGVSLTIAELADGPGSTIITLNIVPTTWDLTTLGARRIGDEVNIETDLVGRYVARLLGDAGPAAGGAAAPTGLTAERLAAWGYR